MQVLVRIKIPSEQTDGVIKLLEQDRIRAEDIIERCWEPRSGPNIRLI